MNRDNPKIISDEKLHKKVFIYDSSPSDNRFFRQAIINFLKTSNGKTFTQTMFEAIWQRNDGGKTLKYCYFDERNQKVRIDNYFYEWMTRTIRKAESELLLISETNLERSVASEVK